MSIFTEPNQGGNPMVSPIVQKAIDLMNKKKAQQPIVAAPDNFEKAYSGYMQEQNTPNTLNTPNTPTGEFSDINTPANNNYTQGKKQYWNNQGSNEPQQVVESAVHNPAVPVVTPEFLKNQFISLKSPEARKRVQQKLKDKGLYKGEIDGEWGRLTEGALLNEYKQSGLQPENTQDELMNLIDGKETTPATQTANSSSSSSSTSTEEKTYPTFDEYVAASGLNPVNQIIESIKPVRKEATEERLKQIAAANAIGDGLRLIGDAAYGDKGSIGANIPKRDNKYTFKAIEDMRALKDKYDKESKDYGMLKLQQLQNMRREWLSDKTRKESAQASKEAATTKMLFDADQNKKKMDNAMAIAKLKGGYAQRIAAARASAGGGGTKNRTTLLHKGSNKVIPIDNSYFNDILSQVLAEKEANGDDKEANAILDSMVKDPNQTKAKALVQKNWEKWYKPNKDYSGIEPKDNTMSNSEYAVRKKNALSNKSNDNIINSFKENSYITLNDAKNVLNNIKSDSKLSKEQKKQLYYEMLLETGNIDGQDISEDEAYTIANELLND